MTEATNKNRQETAKFNLESWLKDMSQTKTRFNSVRKSYDNLYSDKRFKADLKDIANIGSFISDCKSATKGKNANSGAFGDMVKAHFPRLNAQNISLYRWYAENQAKVDEFAKANKVFTNNVEQLKRAIRKHLDDTENTTEADYKEYGLKVGKKNAGGKSKDVEPAVQDGDKVILKRDIDNMKIDELLGWTSAILHKLQERKQNNALQFTNDHLAEMEKLSVEMADLQVAIQVSQSNKAKAVNA